MILSDVESEETDYNLTRLPTTNGRCVLGGRIDKRRRSPGALTRATS